MKALKIILKVLGTLAAMGLLFIILASTITQTDFFKDRLRTLVVSTLSTNTGAQLHLGTIHGNFLTGLTVDSLSIDYGDVKIVSTGTIEIHHDPFALLKKTVIVSRLVIDKPRVTLVRPLDGGWNVARLFQPSHDTSRTPSPWSVILNHVEITNGELTLIDFASVASPGHQGSGPNEFEYHDFALSKINIQLSAAVLPGEIDFSCGKISAVSQSPSFTLSRFAGDIKITREGISAKNVVVETPKSSVQFSASISGPNPFESIKLSKLQYDPTQIQLNARSVDLGEIQCFIPGFPQLTGSASVDLDAGGEFGNLSVRHFNIRSRSTSLKIAGGVKNLHRPDDLRLDLLVGDSKLDAAEVVRFVPSLHREDFGSMSQLTLFGQFNGTPKDFKASASIRSEAGTVDLAGHMNLTQSRPKYELTFSTLGLDFGQIAPGAHIRSSVSSHGDIKGEGLSFDSILAHMSVIVDSGSVQNMSAKSSQVTLDLWPRRFQYTASLAIGGMTAEAKGKVNLTNAEMPVWETVAAANSLDISRLFGDSRYRTALSFTTRVNGSGRSVDDVNADGTLTILQSTVNGYKLGRQDIRFTLEQHEAKNKHLAVQSPMADIEMSGQYDLDFLAAMLADQAKNLASKILHHVEGFDSVAYKNARTEQITERHTTAQQDQDFSYSVTLKNLEPIAGIFGDRPFNAQGSLHGNIKGNEDNLAVSCQGTIDELFSGTINDGILIHQSNINVQADSLGIRRTLHQLKTTIAVSIQSGLLNSLPLATIRTKIDYGHREGSYELEGVVDSTYALRIGGKLSFLPRTYVFDFDSCAVSAADDQWENDNDVQVRVNGEGLRIMHATMKHAAETVSLAGGMDTSGLFDMNLAVKNVMLSEFGRWFRPRSSASTSTLFNGLVSANIHVSGTAASPLLSANLSGENILYKQTDIGSVAARVEYANERATLGIKIRASEADTTPHLFVDGTIPVNLGFVNVAERFPDDEQHIEIKSTEFNINALESLFPELENLNGMMVCNVELGGTPRTPVYRGAISIHDARFTFLPNNIMYTLSGDLEPSGDKLALKNFIIRNVKADRSDGEARVQGTIGIKNFQVDSLDLSVNGQLLVMSEASRRAIPTMYGTLFTAFDAPGLRITQTLKHPKISGRVFIKDQNVTFPPTSQAAFSGSAITLNYIVVEDSSAGREQKKSFAARFYAPSENVSSSAHPVNIINEQTLLERLDYDLVIETQGPSRIRMIFTPSTNEELYAMLDGRVSLRKIDGSPNVQGTISISPGSYYNSLKRFDATGDLNFIGPWDNPDLKITATYEGVHMRDTLPSIPQKTIVQLDITGTRYKPNLQMSMKVEVEPGKDPVDWATQSKGGDPMSDAISFLTTGKFKDELTSQDKANVLSTFGQSGFATSFISGMLTDFMRSEFPFIRTAEVTLRGGSLQESADLRLSMEAFKGYVRFGGQIFNDIGNANVNYQLSLGDVFNAQSIRNLFFEFEHKVEGSETAEERKLTNTARLYYRLAF